VLFDASGYTTGVVPNCTYANKIQLCAYAYDDSREPFANQGTLLKEFNTLLDVNVSYTVRITYYSNYTTYDLLTSPATGKQLLESIQIDHRYCSNYNVGNNLALYFGFRHFNL
jgi:hypothetical protein